MHLATCSPTICDETNSGRDSVSRTARSYKQGRKSESIRWPTLRIWLVEPTKIWSISLFACRVSSGVPTILMQCSATNTSQLATRCDTSFSSPSSEYMYRNYMLVVWSATLRKGSYHITRNARHAASLMQSRAWWLQMYSEWYVGIKLSNIIEATINFKWYTEWGRHYVTHYNTQESLNSSGWMAFMEHQCMTFFR